MLGIMTVPIIVYGLKFPPTIELVVILASKIATVLMFASIIVTLCHN